MTIKFGLIGGGVMGEALLSRLIARGIYQPSEVIVSEPQTARQAFLQQKYHVGVTTDNSLVFTQAQDVVFLAVKPQVFSAIAQELADTVFTDHSPPCRLHSCRGVSKPARSGVSPITSH